MQLELENDYLDSLLHDGTMTEGLDERSLHDIRRKISPQLHDKVTKEMKEYLMLQQTLLSTQRQQQQRQHATTVTTSGSSSGSPGEGEPTSSMVVDLTKAHDFIESVLGSKLLKIEMDASLRVLCKFAKDAQRHREEVKVEVEGEGGLLDVK